MPKIVFLGAIVSLSNRQYLLDLPFILLTPWTLAQAPVVLNARCTIPIPCPKL
jgi:hypothetical protein